MPDYGFNGTRYFDLDTGRFVSSSAVRDALEQVMEASALNMNALSQQLIGNEISLAQWQSSMMQEIKISHIAASTSAQGGWAQMTQSDFGFAGSQIKKQYEYLKNFSNQITSGEQQLNGQVLVRADMYAQASRGTFEEVRRRAEIENGMDEGRRVLGQADHCQDCLAYADEGWMPADEVPAIGDSVCLTNCACLIEYRKSSEVFE